MCVCSPLPTQPLRRRERKTHTNTNVGYAHTNIIIARAANIIIARATTTLALPSTSRGGTGGQVFCRRAQGRGEEYHVLSRRGVSFVHVRQLAPSPTWGIPRGFAAFPVPLTGQQKVRPLLQPQLLLQQEGFFSPQRRELPEQNGRRGRPEVGTSTLISYIYMYILSFAVQDAAVVQDGHTFIGGGAGGAVKRLLPVC